MEPENSTTTETTVASSDSDVSTTEYESELTLDELESHLFECADIIRNCVDKTDYKEYILPLFFYKAFDDTYTDNYNRIRDKKIEEGHDSNVASQLAHDEAFHDYSVAQESRWQDLINTDNTAMAIDEALRQFEELNDFDGITTVEFASVDAFQTTDRLEELLRHLDEKNLSRHRVPEDMLGEAYMDLVQHFAEEEGRDGGEYFTPPKIVELMVQVLEPYEKDTSVHDPTAGSGGMLIKVAQHLQKNQKVPESHWRSIRFTGQEINSTVYAMAQMNLAIHGMTGDIRPGDSLKNPAFTTPDSQLEQFDYILANFPFSARWAKDDLQDDPYSRFEANDKLPRKNRGDYAFILHMVEQLNETGQAGIVVPHGVLFRKNEQKYRDFLIDNDLIEAIIGLPENLFQNASIPCAVLILNAEKPDNREDQIQFIHADDEAFYDELSNQNQLRDDGINEITRIFKDWETTERRSRTVDVDEVIENDSNLNIALYVDTTEPQPDIDVASELEELRELEAQYNELNEQFTDYMQQLNYE